MKKYTDFQFEKSEYDRAKEYNNTDAIVLAARNVLLSKPGNFPFNPSIGVNIRKYQFEFLDSTQILAIQKEIDKALAACVPGLDTIETVVRKIDTEDGVPYLGISIRSILDGHERDINFLLVQDGLDVKIFNEIR